jgi:hypothetical protein
VEQFNNSAASYFLLSNRVRIDSGKMSEPSRGRGRGAKKVVVPRGKGRRSQAEREQLSQAEKERNREKERQYSQQLNAQRLAAQREERERARATGRGGRGGRGRGGYMGDTRAGTGAFSLGSALPGKSFIKYSSGQEFNLMFLLGPSSQSTAHFDLKSDL